MTAREHHYDVQVVWTGNTGRGTSSYQAFSRDHVVRAPHTADILGSSDPSFRGDSTRWNPEQLLVAALSQCHMLWYLHLAAASDVTVLEYSDKPNGLMNEADDGSGRFSHVTLRPTVTISHDSDRARALALHSDVPDYCFITRSVNFTVTHEPTIHSVDPFA